MAGNRAWLGMARLGRAGNMAGQGRARLGSARNEARAMKPYTCHHCGCKTDRLPSRLDSRCERCGKNRWEVLVEEEREKGKCESKRKG